MKNLSKKIYLGITGRKEKDWRDKLLEIERLGIQEVALFLECYKTTQRKKIYKALEESCVKKIPLVRIRRDMGKWELKYLCDKYNNPCLTIHEDHFDRLRDWRGFYKYLYLEMNKDNFVSKKVDVERIGGFCIDFSHFKSAEEKWSREFEYTMQRRKKKGMFVCNHLNGYSYEKNTDIHLVDSLDQFEYLKTLPEFVFGDVIAIETWNSIKDQIKFKKHVLKLLS